MVIEAVPADIVTEKEVGIVTEEKEAEVERGEEGTFRCNDMK